MKRFTSILLCLVLLCALAVPVLADGVPVIFTSDSAPEPGRSLTVDKTAMMNHGSITSEAYNALLEGTVIYRWYRNEVLVLEGTTANSYQVRTDDQGCSLYVTVAFYSSSNYLEQVGSATSQKFQVDFPAPTVTTKSLPNATVGQKYYVRLECDDGDAVFSEFMGSQLSEFGLTLTQHGEIEGTPTKAGNCHVNIVVQGVGGGEDSVSYDITVKEAKEVKITTTQLPQATAGTAYSAKIACEGDAEFLIYYNPGKANDFEKTGLTLAKDGTLSGTPKTAGKYVFTVCAAGTTNEDYMEYTLVVKEAEATEPTENVTTIGTTPTEPAEETEEPRLDRLERDEDDEDEAEIPWWIFVAIGVAAAGIGVVVAVLIIKKKK